MVYIVLLAGCRRLADQKMVGSGACILKNLEYRPRIHLPWSLMTGVPAGLQRAYAATAWLASLSRLIAAIAGGRLLEAQPCPQLYLQNYVRSQKGFVQLQRPAEQENVLDGCRFNPWVIAYLCESRMPLR